MPLGLSWPWEAANRASGRKSLFGDMITKDFCTYAINILRHKKVFGIMVMRWDDRCVIWRHASGLKHHEHP